MRKCCYSEKHKAAYCKKVSNRICTFYRIYRIHKLFCSINTKCYQFYEYVSLIISPSWYSIKRYYKIVKWIRAWVYAIYLYNSARAARSKYVEIWNVGSETIPPSRRRTPELVTCASRCYITDITQILPNYVYSHQLKLSNFVLPRDDSVFAT